VDVGTGVSVAVGVGVGVTPAVGVGVGLDVIVAVAIGVEVGVGVTPTVGVGVGVGAIVGVGVTLGFAVGVGLGVGLGLNPNPKATLLGKAIANNTTSTEAAQEVTFGLKLLMRTVSESPRIDRTGWSFGCNNFSDCRVRVSQEKLRRGSEQETERRHTRNC
jgi:hypothetical protein